VLGEATAAVVVEAPAEDVDLTADLSPEPDDLPSFSFCNFSSAVVAASHSGVDHALFISTDMEY